MISRRRPPRRSKLDCYARRYAEGDAPWDSGKPSEELVRLLDADKLPGKTVLEIGCGTGTNALEFARRGFKVTAVDDTKIAVRLAREKARRVKLNVDFHVANVLQDDLGGPYDILFDRGLYHHIRCESKDLNSFQDVLGRVTHRDSRWLCLACNAQEQLAGYSLPGVHERDILAEMCPLFDIVELRKFRFTNGAPPLRPLAWSILMRRKQTRRQRMRRC